MDFSLSAKITKLDEEKRLAFGWFSIIEEGGEPVVDGEGDVIKTEDLEDAAYDFVLNARIAGENHVRKGVGQLVESMVFTKEKQETLGIDLGFVGWWGGFFISDDEVWKAVKEGDFESFSIGGTGERKELNG